MRAATAARMVSAAMVQWEPDAAEELISQVIRDRAIFPVFQPIRDLTTGALVGVEALARGPAGSAVESAPTLFAAAKAAGELSRVDQLAFTRAIETARDSPRPLPLRSRWRSSRCSNQT
jgi:EAL domain-containing protein (putative c-di-GMP-specific phosphodiesterase class I)